jgi:hypothetical protein
MSVDLTIEIARREEALRVPNAALVFQPTNRTFAALGQRMPEVRSPRHRAPRGPVRPVTRLRSAGLTIPDAGTPSGRWQTAWLYEDDRLEPVELLLGISDGTYTEVLNGEDLPPNARVVLEVLTGTEEETQQPDLNDAPDGTFTAPHGNDRRRRRAALTAAQAGFPG